MTKSKSQLLCKSCGLCCSGHLFVGWRLNAPELDSAQSLGLNVIRDDPVSAGTARAFLSALGWDVYGIHLPELPAYLQNVQVHSAKKVAG